MRMPRLAALTAVLVLAGVVNTSGLYPSAAHAAGAVTVSMTSDPHLGLDSNTPCTNGMDSAYVEFTLTNNTGTALSNATATISGFTSGFSLSGGDSASRPITSLANSAQDNEFWFVTYPCTKPPSSGVGQSDTLTVTVTSGTSSLGSGTASVGTYSAISAQAGGNLTSATISSATYQQVAMDVTYSFGNSASGTEFDFQPAGNPSTVSSSDFNAGCFRLIGAQIQSSAISSVPVGGTAIYYVANSSTNGSNNLVSIRYFFAPQCVGTSTTAFPYALETSGSTNVKYSGNYGVNVSVPATVASTAVTAVTTSLTPSVYGQSVTFTASVSRTPNSGVAGGTVAFVADSGTANQLTLCSAATLDGSGIATCPYSTLSSGSHTITANYSGDTNDLSSSGTLSGGQTVTTAGTTTVLGSSLNPTTTSVAVTLTATVAPASGTGIPTGTVSFYDGTTLLGTGTLATSAGVTTAQITQTFTTTGTHSLSATYAGDTNFTGSNGPYSETVGTSAPSMARVSDFRAARQGTRVDFAWHMAMTHTVVGFNVYAGRQRVNRQTIAAHRSPSYRYGVRWAGTSRYTLEILFANGSTTRVSTSVRQVGSQH